MIVRRLIAGDDLSAAVSLLIRFFEEEGFVADKDRIARHTQILAGLQTCGLFVAEEDGVALGVATVSLEFGIEYGWWAEMGDLYVLPKYRGRSVSRLLVEEVEAFLREKGAVGYQVTVTPFAAERHNLAEFYRKLGFDSEGRIILLKELNS